MAKLAFLLLRNRAIKSHIRRRLEDVLALGLLLRASLHHHHVNDRGLSLAPGHLLLERELRGVRAFQVARALRRHEQLIATGTTLAPTGLEHESFRREFNIILIHFLVDDILRQQLLDQTYDLRIVLHILSPDP